MLLVLGWTDLSPSCPHLASQGYCSYYYYFQGPALYQKLHLLPISEVCSSSCMGKSGGYSHLMQTHLSVSSICWRLALLGYCDCRYKFPHYNPVSGHRYYQYESVKEVCMSSCTLSRQKSLQVEKEHCQHTHIIIYINMLIRHHIANGEL